MFYKSVVFLWETLILIICEAIVRGDFSEENQISKQLFIKNEQTADIIVQEEWIIQNLDHFNPNDLRKWKQRYFINDKYYKYGGPAFLMIGGETDNQVGWMTNGTWIEYAKRFGALCFLLEHRFYGQSRPTEDTSLKNLQYFTVKQALADLATFIAEMNNKYEFEENNKWIAFGGSYPGMLAAWLRLKYPHLVHGVVSSSGVFLPTMDYGVIAEILKAHSSECEKAIKDGTMEVNALLQQKHGGQILTERFHTCDPIDESLDENDIANLNLCLAANFAFIQLYKEDWSFLGFVEGYSNITVEMVCDIMSTTHQKSAMERLADVNSLMLRAGSLECLDYKYKKMIDTARNTSWDARNAGADDRRWCYLLCTEIATFITSSFQLGTFGDKFPVEFYIRRCMDMFGPEYNAAYINERIEMMNTEYGGLNINITNTVFIQGSWDPWHLAGILKNVTYGPPVIYIEGTAHVADMIPESKDDLPQLKAARKQIAEYINQWLHQ